MKKRRLLSLLLAFVLLFALAGCSNQTESEPDANAEQPGAPSDTPAEQPEEEVTIRVAALSGPTAIGMVKLMADSEQGETQNTYEFTVAGAPDEITGKVIQGEFDIAAVPTNVASVLYNKGRTAGLDHVDYLPLFVIVAAIMVVSVAIVFLTVKEPKLEAEVAAYEAKHPEENLVEKDAATGKEVLPAPVRRSLGFLLASIALWFIGYNAMETWFTTYAQAEWGMALGEASRCLIVANVGAIVSYIPVGAIASRVGRKRTIQGGIVLLGGGFAFCAAWTFAGMGFSPALYVVMIVLGMGWAGINVNSLPMVVEMCKGSDTGKFTGLYYTFSMAAQTVTPIAAGWLMHNVSYRSLFIYATVFVAASFVTMLFVHHGDSKLVEKRGLESFDVD